jgi:hypothetical protein
MPKRPPNNDFVSDDAFQRERRDAVLKPLFYEQWFHGNYHFCDQEEPYLKRGTDTVIATMRQTVTVDEKIVRERHSAFALETRSCTVAGYESPGWMFWSEVDRLLYCFPLGDGLDCWWIDMPALQGWFWPKETTFPQFKMEKRNRSAGRVVDIAAVQHAGVAITNFRLVP